MPGHLKITSYTNIADFVKMTLLVSGQKLENIPEKSLMVLQIVSVDMGAFFHLGRSSFVNYPFCPCFSNRSKQIYIVRSQKYRSFSIYFSCFPSERLVKKIVHSEKKRYFFLKNLKKSFVQ